MMRTRSKAVCLAAAVALLATAGCDSGAEEKTAEAPRIPADSAARLAGMSDQIAAELEAGDVCGAAEQADELSDAVERARLPERFREVEAVATTLVDRVNCPPPPEPVEPKEEKGKHGKGEGGDGGADEDYESAKLRWPGDHLPPGQAKKIEGD